MSIVDVHSLYRDKAEDWFFENGIEEYVETTTIGDPAPVYRFLYDGEWLSITCHEMGFEMAYGNIKKLKISDDQVVEMDQHDPKKGLMSVRDVAEAKKQAEAEKKEDERHKVARDSSRGDFIDMD